MKKIILSLVRTILAVALIAISMYLFMKAINWQCWAPDNDYGFLVVTTLYLVSILGVFSGLYGISPIFWTALSYAIFPSSISDEEYEENLRQGRREIRKLRKWFVW